ncbi:hypothetical protein GXW74_16965 [Roseomonas eburnea]|uniref:Uncharacterized protein n=1 Tax=Neoroseomonas eburnea TaxID=1346889 RepID=A0A9X9XEQ0_9PROT|nr:DUF2798 domain-containing protein [Neoroseomonas eburnea]MBR0682186.1 hypothetical protein [Neoroseomonas eburnea]
MPARFAGIVMPPRLLVIVTCIVWGASAALAPGILGEAPTASPADRATSWPVASPILLVVLPIVRRLVAPPAR